MKQDMKRYVIILALFLLSAVLAILLSAVMAQAQGTVQIRRARTVPTNCDPAGLTGPALVWKTATTTDTCGSSKGLCECTAANTWTYRTNLSSSGIVAKTFAYWNAGSALTSSGAPTNGQLLIGSTGLIPVVAAITGTSNQITVTNGAGSITIAAPQNIHTAATPTFAGLTLSGAQLNAAGTAGAPSISFSGDPDSGMISSAANSLGFVTNGVEKWIINSSGAFNPVLNNTYDIGNGTVNPRDVHAGRQVVLYGSTSGSTTLKAAATAGTTTLTLPAGTTDFSATGGAAQFVKQSSAGAALTVAAITAPELYTVSEARLSTTASVNMNSATDTVLYTCPTGRTCVITRVVVRNASTSLTTASYSFGWNDDIRNDVIVNATHTELTAATRYTVLVAAAGSTLGTADGTFGVLMNTLQGGAATTTVDVFGYTF